MQTFWRRKVIPPLGMAGDINNALSQSINQGAIGRAISVLKPELPQILPLQGLDNRHCLIRRNLVSLYLGNGDVVDRQY